MSRDPQSVPGWQTEELQDEWVDLEPEGDGDEDDYLSYGTRSISFTVPLSTHIHTNSDFEPDVTPSTNNSRAIGTFLVREDLSNKPLLPKMPGRNKKGLIKDFFSPMPLERMFDPPSPHSPSSGAPSQPSDSSSLSRPQTHSTPNLPPAPPHNVAPLADSRLRLFQFQYDTYTREHLSALVDSIAINTPSGTGTTASCVNIRSTKRLKLSPSCDFQGEGAGSQATVSRPKLYGKDYVGESRSLMQQIKQARDFSTISTVASDQESLPSISNGLQDKFPVPPSFVKPAGPAHIRTIAPGDLPSLPERFGDMLFDKVMMKWIKSTAKSAMEEEEKSANNFVEVSDDPFGDIESLRDDSKTGPEIEESARLSEEDVNLACIGAMSIIEEQSEVDDGEMELTSFSTDASAHVVNIMTGVETDGYDDDDLTTDSDDADDLHTATQAVINDIEFDSEYEDAPPQNNSPAMESSDLGSHLLEPPPPPAKPITTPNRGKFDSLNGTPVIKSALKSNSLTPTSALKNSQRYQTPVHRKGHHRSVSFSDGKRDGPIRGIASGGPSVRSKRIADVMDALESSDLDEDESPSKTSSAGRPDILQPLTSRHPSSTPAGVSKVESPRRVFSRSYSHKLSPGKQGFSKANGTFLTECSFAVAHDRLVEVITDIQPFEPHWEDLNSIDLSNAKLESVARLKEFLPRLDALSLNRNQLSWLSGIPGSVRTLSVAYNCLTGLASYSHLLNLENLDISHNQVDSLRQLEGLRHLRELKTDGNKLTSLDGLERMDTLVKLSVQGNLIQSVDLSQYRWTRLEMLNLSHNRLNGIQSISSLQSLIALNLDINSLGDLPIGASMPRLRILRVSGNRLSNLDVGAMSNLRTLYADNNTLANLVKVDRLTKLENLSLRNQSGGKTDRVIVSTLSTRDVRDVKRLYLSGNPLKHDFLNDACYNVVYLELAACRLTALPEGMSRLVPNLRVLNLNYNFLEDVRPLEGLTRLQKLTIIGSRLKNTKPLIRLLENMPDVEMLDFRMNPCTLGWYLPLLVKDVPGALQPSERRGEGWQALDSKFRRDLPNSSYIGRLAYRGLIMRACGRIGMLDGVSVSEKERMKANGLLDGILG